MPRGKAKRADTKTSNDNGAKLGFETQLILAAEPPRTHLEPSDHKHIALGLIFLKHISHTVVTRQSPIDTPVRLRQARLFSLQAFVNERSTPGLAA